MKKLEKKYRSLRVIAWFFKLGAWISLALGFILFFAVLFGGKIILHLMQGNSPYMQYMEMGQTAGAFFILGVFLVNTLILYAISSTIHLFIDIEANTRQAARLLETAASFVPPSTPIKKEGTSIEKPSP